MTWLAKIFHCNNYEERIEKLSQQDKLSKFCMDAGFLNVVEIGQYVMTKDTAEFSQFTDAVACREYTLPREEEASEPKGWIRGNTKIGVHWVDIKLAQKKGLKLYQTRSKSGWKLEKCFTKKYICVSSTSSKDFLETCWMKDLGSEVARQAEGEVVRQAEGSQPTQPTQPNPNPNHDRTVKTRCVLKITRPVLRKSTHVSFVTARTPI